MSRATTVFAGGGSGGHLFPGIAVAEALQEFDPNVVCKFVGSDRPIEQRIATEQRLDHTALPLLPTGAVWRTPVRFMLQACRGYQAARKLLHDWQPRAVVGLGGWSSVPVLLAARRLGLRTLILEQNAIPGRATRWLAPWVDVVCTSFADTPGLRARQVQVTGNPVRAKIARLAHLEPTSSAPTPTLLILGGSQGAERLNDGIVSWLTAHPHQLHSWHVIHQTGPRQVDSLKATYANIGINATVADFIPDLLAAYQQASIVITRAGATTLAELACIGRAMILVPLPNAANDHQSANARCFVAANAAMLAPQGRIPTETAASLQSAWEALTADPALAATLAANTRDLARPNAAQTVAQLILAAPQ